MNAFKTCLKLGHEDSMKVVEIGVWEIEMGLRKYERWARRLIRQYTV
jgi:hypothetical protein